MHKMIEKIHSHKGFRLIAILFIVLLLILTLTRIWASIMLRYRTNAQAIPVVNTIKVTLTTKAETVLLPGTISAWHEAPVYARVNGYLKQWFVDIGDNVKKGDLLALIEAPEIDAQLRQAEADLKVAIANNQLAQVTAKRWINLLKTDSVSKQETDEKKDTARALNATVLAKQANRDRLRDLVNFERIIAPFSGTISARSTDIGALINEGSNQMARPLFRIVQNDPLRVYVKIPENYSSRITPHITVKLEFAEYPGLIFPARLFQTAEAIDPKTRTLLAQFTMNNKDGKLLPGGYTQISIQMPAPPAAVFLPVNTLLFRAEGLQVATLNNENQVLLKSITISRDFGNEVEVDSGLQPGEDIIINPADSIYNGQQVKMAEKHK